MKYIAPAALFLCDNEIMSLLALCVMVIMFLFDIIAAKEAQKWS